MNINFEQYQNKYGNYQIHSLPVEILLIGFNKLRTGFHHIAIEALEVIKGPNLVVKVMSVAFDALSYIPGLKPTMSWAKLLLKNIKNVTNFIKGFQSIDGILNFKFSWKIIVLNVSGLVLFVVSSITLAEKFLINCSAIKTALAAIPVFGTLPFGGLLHLPLVGISGSLFLLSLDKYKKLNNTAKKINDKIEFWKEPLDANKIASRQIKYREKIAVFQKNIVLKEQQVEEGRQAKEGIPTNEKRKLKVHQIALEKLMVEIDKEKNELKILEEKERLWKYLETHFDEVDFKNLQSYQNAKVDKWKAKFKKNVKEKRVNYLSMMDNIFSIANQIIVIATVISGVGLTVLPFMLLGLGAISASFGVANYFMRRSIKKIKISPIKMYMFTG